MIYKQKKGTIRIALLQTMLLILFSKNAFSQKSMYLTVFAMPQRTFINNRYDNQNTKSAVLGVSNGERYFKTHPTYTQSIGFLIKYSLREKFLLCYGLQYSNLAQSYSISRDSMNTLIEKGRIRLSYLKLPLLFQYNYLVKQKYFLFAGIGPQLSTLFYERGAVPIYDKEFISFNLVDAGSLYKNFNIDGVVNLGGEFRVTSKAYFFLQARMEYSFNDIEKKSAEELYYSQIYKIFDHGEPLRGATHTIAIGMSIGLTFKIR